MATIDALPCDWPQGRPPKYHSGLLIDMLRGMQAGHTNAMIASSWGISEKTFYEWKEKHPDFKEAYDIADTARKGHVEGLLLRMATGDIKGDFKALIAYLNQKYGYSGTNPNLPSNTINIGNMNVLSMDPKEIDKKIAHIMDKYGATTLKELEHQIAEVVDEQDG